MDFLCLNQILTAADKQLQGIPRLIETSRLIEPARRPNDCAKREIAAVPCCFHTFMPMKRNMSFAGLRLFRAVLIFVTKLF